MTNPVPNGEEQTVLSRRLVRYGLIWGVWTVVALFFTTQVYVSYYAENQPIRYLQGFLFQATICYLWALVTAFVLWLARRFRIERSNWVRRSLLHFVFSIVLTGTLIAIHSIVFMTLMGRASSITPLRVFNLLYFNLDNFALVY